MTASTRRHKVVRIIARLNIGGPALHVLGVTQALSPRYSTALVYGVGGQLAIDGARLVTRLIA